MSDIDRIVNVVITRQTTVPSIASFDIPIIAAEFLTTSTTPNFTTRTKLYSGGATAINTALTTEFGSTSEVTLTAAKILAQSPSISSLYVGRKLTGGEGSETWSAALTAMNLEDSNWYAVSAATRTLAEQQDAADWVETNKKFQGISSGDSNIISGTGDIAEYLSTNNYDRSFVLYHPDSNVNNISTIVYDADFVTLNSIEVVINSISVVTVFDTDQDTTMANIKANIEADSSLVGIVATLTDTDGDNRTIQLYWLGKTLTVTSTVTLGASQAVATITGSTAEQYPAEAWVGERFPFDPGSTNWTFKTLAGVTAYPLTGAEITTIEGKNGNYYTSVSNVSVTQFGTVGSGEYIDIIRGLDWLEARIQQLIFTSLVNLPKVPYTNAGIQVIVTRLEEALQEGVDRELLAPGFVTTAPDVTDISVTDKGNRLLPDIEFTATLAGAINKVEVNGVVTL